MRDRPLPGLEIPFRTPTSFLFFAASGFAAYNSPSNPALSWFAYSAFMYFLALGPLRWIDSYWVSMPWQDWQGTEHYDETRTAPAIETFFARCMIVLVLTGSGLGLWGMYALYTALQE